MKVDNLELQKEKTELVSQKTFPKELTYLGTIRPHKGQKVYALNLETKDMYIAKYSETATMNYPTNSTKVPKLNKRLIVEQNTIYCSAINFKNAEKQFKKQLINHILKLNPNAEIPKSI